MKNNLSSLENFTIENSVLDIDFIEEVVVKKGVICFIYNFRKDRSKDLALVEVKRGFKTPLQRILEGDVTLEGFVHGIGTLTVTDISGIPKVYSYPEDETIPIHVKIGETMQWQASNDVDLVFYEVCTPPYQDGRFKNLD